MGHARWVYKCFLSMSVRARAVTRVVLSEMIREREISEEYFESASENAEWGMQGGF